MNEDKSAAVLPGTAQDFDMQALLDREFPKGALCVVMHKANDRIAATQSCLTGRLVCDRFEKDEGSVWYHLIIDPRERVDGDSDTIQLWIDTPHRHHDSQSLWEANVRAPRGDAAVLRLNTEPPEQWRPTAKMRSAVSERYADLLAARRDTA
jgi:hypothetical protein